MKAEVKRLKNILKLANCLILTLLLLLVAACDDVTHDEYFIDYYPDVEDSPSKSISLMRADSDSDVLYLVLDVYDISGGPIYSFSFDLVFRDWIMEYVGYDTGTFLERSGDVVYQVGLDSGDSGRLIVGVTLTGDAEPLEGSGTLMYFTFRPRRLGTCPFALENTQIRGSNGPAGDPITGIPWFGGYAKVRQ
jgi:hypothetical protein